MTAKTTAPNKGQPLRGTPRFRKNAFMSFRYLTIAALGLIQAVDPLKLPLGLPGTVSAKPGEIIRTLDGAAVSVDSVAAAADGHRFVYLGESHTTLAHHEMQAAVIDALAKRGRDVIVGFEMFTRPVQNRLNPWTLGWWSEEDFIREADWKGQWGFDFALYRPIFEVIKSRRLRMVALNVPRDWVRRVGRQGPAGLTDAEKAQVPAIDVSIKGHRSVFDALMGGHPPTGPQGENIYAAQVLWDVGMADSALKYLAENPTTSKTVMVVVAGSGHVMYGQGINYRVWSRTGERGITLTMTESDRPIDVSRGLGDYVFTARPKA